MPFTHKVLPEQKLGVIWIMGPVTGSEIVEAHEALFLDPAWQPGFGVLWDARRISELLVTPPEVQSFSAAVEKLKPAIGNARVAVVTQRETDQFAAAMLTAKSSRILKDEQKVFQSLESAAEWLAAPMSVIAEHAPRE